MLWGKQWLKEFSVKNKNFLFLRTSVRTSKVFFSLWTSNLFFFTNRKSQININLFKGRWKIPMTWICNTFLEKNFLSKTICFIQKQQNSFQIQPFQKTFVNTHWNCVPYSWNYRKACFTTILLHHSSLFINKKNSKLGCGWMCWEGKFLHQILKSETQFLNLFFKKKDWKSSI